jgi:hypothetical protein
MFKSGTRESAESRHRSVAARRVPRNAGAAEAASRREVTALVWVADESQASEALENLHRGLWPYWFTFKISEVRRFPAGIPNPLRYDDPATITFSRRERWMWVLVPLGAEPGAVSS